MNTAAENSTRVQMRVTRRPVSLGTEEGVGGRIFTLEVRKSQATQSKHVSMNEANLAMS